MTPRRVPGTPPERPKRRQEHPRSAPRGAKSDPRGAKTAPRGARSAPRAPQEPPKSGDKKDYQMHLVAGKPLEIDFGASGPRFWSLRGSIFELPGLLFHHFYAAARFS